MSRPEQHIAANDPRAESDETSRFQTRCYHNAINRLQQSYDENHPLAILIGEGHSAASFVINNFLSNLEEDVIVAQITEPCTDATDLMRKIIRAVGFRPKSMTLSDLESIFAMFLSYQKGHGRRTVLCVEQIQDSDWWVLDRVRRLVETESENGTGLMTILSGQPEIKELLHKQPLSAIFALTGQSIWLAPFTLAETREYIRRRVEIVDGTTVDQLFQYHAIPIIHDLSGGVPDAIGALVSRCREMADEEGLDLVTTQLVNRANESLQRSTGDDQDTSMTDTVTLNGIQPAIGRLVIQLQGTDVREKALSQGHVLIGRSKLCDIWIDRPNVSRHHALISYAGGRATLIDLDSTNGTSVDGYRVKYHELSPGETIAVGDCRIEYVTENEAVDPARIADRMRVMKSRPH